MVNLFLIRHSSLRGLGEPGCNVLVPLCVKRAHIEVELFYWCNNKKLIFNVIVTWNWRLNYNKTTTDRIITKKITPAFFFNQHDIQHTCHEHEFQKFIFNLVDLSLMNWYILEKKISQKFFFSFRILRVKSNTD